MSHKFIEVKDNLTAYNNMIGYTTYKCKTCGLIKVTNKNTAISISYYWNQINGSSIFMSCNECILMSIL